MLNGCQKKVTKTKAVIKDVSLNVKIGKFKCKNSEKLFLKNKVIFGENPEI